MTTAAAAGHRAAAHAMTAVRPCACTAVAAAATAAATAMAAAAAAAVAAAAPLCAACRARRSTAASRACACASCRAPSGCAPARSSSCATAAMDTLLGRALLARRALHDKKHRRTGCGGVFRMPCVQCPVRAFSGQSFVTWQPWGPGWTSLLLQPSRPVQDSKPAHETFACKLAQQKRAYALRTKQTGKRHTCNRWNHAPPMTGTSGHCTCNKQRKGAPSTSKKGRC
eukprot:364487-Chlamydomonas_euryale.AAC.1